MAEREERMRIARDLMKEFAQRTGIGEKSSGEKNRYLWTDAFAVKSFFALSGISEKNSYMKDAKELINLVNGHLGKHHPKDERTGWISGLPEEEGKLRPTIQGLRIGKELPERKPGEPYDERLEWNRDGQYFHYLTRWFHALLTANRRTGNSEFLQQAEDLLRAGTKFIDPDYPRRMYWKMSTDLSRPLVKSMGAHDPLEGLICALSLKSAKENDDRQINKIVEDFKLPCQGQDWSTTDALGIGGLLLNTAKAIQLSQQQTELPNPIQPEKLIRESLMSLTAFTGFYDPGRAANRRLAFRECGLSLGIRVITSLQHVPPEMRQNLHKFKDYLAVAEEIENFWSRKANRESPTWEDHLDINAVSLASSLLATQDPAAFSGESRA